MQIIDGRKFTWKGNQGTAESSDLMFKDWPASFYIMSHRTGQHLCSWREQSHRSVRRTQFNC